MARITLPDTVLSGPHTWPKTRRLLRRPDFLACYDQGERRYTRHFVVFVRSGYGPARVGLAVTRKSGNAVARGRIKRVLREYFRLNQALLPNADIVVTPKRHLRVPQVNLAMVSAELTPLFLPPSNPFPAGRDAPRRGKGLT